MPDSASVTDFHHVFTNGRGSAARTTLLMLHGTGGDEHDLVPLARALKSGAAILAPRGRVLENGMPRFFRRLREGVFDEADLRMRTAELADWVRAALAAYDLDPDGVVAVGFSNGANIAASLHLLEPRLLPASVLIRAMVPLEPSPPPELHGVATFLAGGRLDPMIPAVETERLATMLESYGADVTTHWEPGGHGLTAGDVAAAQSWLARRPPLG
jgi:predicted esterase